MRRKQLKAARAARAASLVASMGLPGDVAAAEAVWLIVSCPGCGRHVAFEPGQKANRCAHCKTAVIRGLV